MGRPARGSFVRFSFRAAALFALLNSTVVHPDAVYLRDESVIRGEIASIHAGVVVVSTSFAGQLNLPMKEIVGIDTDLPLTLATKGGGTKEGRLVFENTQQRVSLGDRSESIALDQIIEGMPHTPDDRPQSTANWSGRAEFSLDGDKGNTDEFNALLGVSTTRTGTLDRLTLSLRSRYEESDGAVKTNEGHGSAAYERDITDRQYFFTRLELEYDRFERVDARARFITGLGRFLIRNPRQDLKILGGVGIQHERFDEGSEDTKPQLGAGYDYRLDVGGRVLFRSLFVYIVDPTQFDDWTVNADNSAEIPLSNRKHWKLRLGVRNDYDAEPLPGVEELDTSYYLTLAYTWD